MRAGHDGEALGEGQRRHAERSLGAVARDDAGAFADDALETEPERGSVDHAEHGQSLLDVAQHDAELAALLDELVGAVDWVDEEGALGGGEGCVVFLGALLGDDGHTGKLLLQGGDDELVRALVGQGHRVGRPLELNRERCIVHIHDDGGGALRQRGEKGEDVGVIGGVAHSGTPSLSRVRKTSRTSDSGR